MSRKNKISFSEALSMANEKFGDKYSYEKFNFNGMTTKSSIICKKHGEFEMTMWNHAVLGQECPKCKGRNLTTDDVVEMFKEKHGNKYDYGRFEYSKMHSKSTITCKLHGDFQQTPSKHLLGQGCPKCKIAKSKEFLTLSRQVVIERAKSVHNGKYSYENLEYLGMRKPCVITCPMHGNFTQIAEDHLNGHGCPKCSHIVSKVEDEIKTVLENIIGKETPIDTRDKITLNGKEIDILIPSLKFGIEVNGDRWHSNLFKDKYYHISKKKSSKEKGIELLMINESEFNHNKCTIAKIISSLILDKIDDNVIELMKELKLITIDESMIAIDNRYSTESLCTYIESNFNVKNKAITSPTLTNTTNSKYKYWNCGFLTYKL